MKFKKLLISASAIAAGSGLLATILTSCAKANVDEKLKVTLDDNGQLYKTGNMKSEDYSITYKDAIKRALTRSNNWGQFKTALADELIYNWFTDRMSPSKESAEKNSAFRTSYDEWEYQINKDYKDLVQNCKTKHGANWEFYLQNEYLAPLGGTEEAYKHAKMVEKIRADFISKVFAKNYFSMSKDTSTGNIYRHIYSEASKDIDKNYVRNPANWDKIGFFAKSDLSFIPGEDPKTDYSKVNADYLARHPDGDYAAIQDYVFNRWFTTEKPFFSDAALFKYSNPKYAAGGKLENIYDGTRTGVKVPSDKPNEAFPFFGAGADGSTRKAVEFMADFEAGKFATPYSYEEGGVTKTVYTNGTITIPKEDTDDEHNTVLLVYGNQMFAGTNALYIPYAMASGNLYAQMMTTSATASPNKLDAQTVADNINSWGKGSNEDFAILSNFFFSADTGVNPLPDGITSVLNLKDVYGAISSETPYHCPLFAECKTYDWFYGNDTKDGIQYITNNVQVDDFQSDDATLTPSQPWVMELNETGVHIQTIDAFNYIKYTDSTKATERSDADKQTALKNAIKFRLMQKQINDDCADIVAADLLGESGKLKTYFSDNLTNIILEMASIKKTDANYEKYNIFRNIDTYKKAASEAEDKNIFLYNIWANPKLGSSYENLIVYLNSTISFETKKKNFDAIEAANNKIYAYRSKQITNTKAIESFSKTIFENGLLAPFVYVPSANSDNGWTYDYSTVNRIILEDTTALQSGSILDALNTDLSTIESLSFVTEATNAPVNDTNNGFSPQIKTAKDKTSNRFWYESRIIDKLMYSYMGTKTATANHIKMNAYDYYGQKLGINDWFGYDSTTKTTSGKIWGSEYASQAFATTIARNKLITGDKTLASYTDDSELTAEDYWTLMGTKYIEDYLNRSYITSGLHSEEIAAHQLFKATVMYLVSNNFENFYKIMDTKIGEDELAMTAYMTTGYLDETDGTVLNDEELSTSAATDYDFNANVGNIFDKTGMSGRTGETSWEKSSKLAVSNYWTVLNKTLNGVDKQFAGFLGLQTKTNNQLDSTSNMQTQVFNTFSKTIVGSHNADKPTEDAYKTNAGCWFQFAGAKKDAKTGDDSYYTFNDVSAGGTTVNCDTWFPKGTEYVNVRKLAKKIAEYRSTDDLRNLAKTLASVYDGYSYFTPIALGEQSFSTIEEMKVAMMKLLPSAKTQSGWNSAPIECFQRVSNAEAHTKDINKSFVFKNSKAKTGYKALLTQVNKADITEQTLAPTYDADAKEWKQGNSPITPSEFFVILFNMASETSVQQKCVTEVVKEAFGDDKLIVYDAQLYNQFDSVWIKDWTKKTLGA